MIYLKDQLFRVLMVLLVVSGLFVVVTQWKSSVEQEVKNEIKIEKLEKSIELKESVENAVTKANPSRDASVALERLLNRD